MEVEEGINRLGERQQREEIIKLKKRRHSLEKKMEELEKQRPNVVRLAQSLRELMENIESIQERIKGLWNPDPTTRIKMLKKEARFFKELDYLDVELAREYEKGDVPRDIVKKFVSVIVHLRQGDIPEAKRGFRYFDEMIRSSREFDTVAEEIEKRKRMLTREQHKIQKLLSDMDRLENEAVDLEKAGRYEKLLKDVDRLKELRLGYFRSLKSKPLLELLANVEALPVKDQLPDYPGADAISELRCFFLEYPALGAKNTDQICDLCNQSEKKIAHICPETSRFRKIVLSRRRWFEALNDLGPTPFLAVDYENRKVMDFYARNINGAQETVRQIRSLGQEMHSDKEEYKKNKRIRERKGELSGYSKKDLEKQLEEIEYILKLLHSDQEDFEGGQGLMSRIRSFFSQ